MDAGRRGGELGHPRLCADAGPAPARPRLAAGPVACGLLLVGAAIVTQGLQVQPGSAEIAIALGIAAAYLMIVARMMPVPEERTQLFKYGVVAVHPSSGSSTSLAPQNPMASAGTGEADTWH